LRHQAHAIETPTTEIQRSFLLESSSESPKKAKDTLP